MLKDAINSKNITKVLKSNNINNKKLLKLVPVKSGPKSTAKIIDINKKLKELYLQDGITYGHAGEIADCSPEYASLMFKKFGDEIAQHKEPDEDWLSKNDRVRDRALEGLSRKIKSSDDTIDDYNTRIRESKQVHLAILPNAASQLEKTALGGIITRLDVKKMLEIYNLVGSALNMHKNYGYYVETIINNKREEITFHAQLQQQYDTIEILPPAKEVLNAMIERRIAEKNNIKPLVLDASMGQYIKEKTEA